MVLFAAMASGTFLMRDRFGFSASVDGIDESKFEAIAYFTAVTVSTLGYGDITPTTPFA